MTRPAREGYPSSALTVGVTIEVPEPYRSQLQDARRSFGDPVADSVPPHVTLVPPTEIPPGTLGRVTDHLTAQAHRHGPFEMRLRGTGTFRPVSAVVFVQVVVGIAECERLEVSTRSGPLDKPTRFHYHPHVTVAHDLAPDRLDEAFSALSDFDATFPVTSFVLFEHGPDGVWHTVRRFDLLGSGPARRR